MTAFKDLKTGSSTDKAGTGPDNFLNFYHFIRNRAKNQEKFRPRGVRWGCGIKRNKSATNGENVADHLCLKRARKFGNAFYLKTKIKKSASSFRLTGGPVFPALERSARLIIRRRFFVHVRIGADIPERGRADYSDDQDQKDYSGANRHFDGLFEDEKRHDRDCEDKKQKNDQSYFHIKMQN
jgi:hypothetical protein